MVRECGVSGWICSKRTPSKKLKSATLESGSDPDRRQKHTLFRMAFAKGHKNSSVLLPTPLSFLSPRLMASSFVGGRGWSSESATGSLCGPPQPVPGGHSVATTVRPTPQQPWLGQASSEAIARLRVGTVAAPPQERLPMNRPLPEQKQPRYTVGTLNFTHFHKNSKKYRDVIDQWERTTATVPNIESSIPTHVNFQPSSLFSLQHV